MNSRTSSKLLILFVILASGLVTSACNRQTDAPNSEPSSEVVSLEVPTDQAPTIELTAAKDHYSGWNISVETTNWTFTPEKIGQEHSDGEGYFEISVNDELVGRMYEPWYHITAEPGDKVTLTAFSNSQQPYQVQGQLLSTSLLLENGSMDSMMEGEAMMGDDTMMEDRMMKMEDDSHDAMGMDHDQETKEDHAAHGHDHDAPFIVTEAVKVPTVSLEVTPDPTSGWNARLTTTNFKFTPEKASQDETEVGEGHAHIYRDGEKLARVYSEWFYIPTLPAGSSEISVSLNANSHNPYNYDGVDVGDSVTVEVAE